MKRREKWRKMKVCVVTCFTWRSDARICTSAVTSCRTSPAVFEFECCLKSGFSIKGCKPLISSAVLQAHRSSVRYCYYSSLVNQRARDQTISHHTRWKLKQLNMSWVTQIYSTTFSYFGDFSPCIADEGSSWRAFFVPAQGHNYIWWHENGLKRNERFAEECTEVESNEDFYCLHVFYNKRWRR